MIRYGVNPIGWTNDDDRTIGAHISLEQCLDEASGIGFEGIEMGHRFPTDAPALKATLAPYGLSLVSGWHSMNLLSTSVDEEKRSIQSHIDLLSAMGCSVCIVCETSNAVHGRDSVPLNDRPVLRPDEWQAFGGAVESIAGHCADHGLTLVYHHHMGTVVQTPEEIDRFMEVTGPSTKLLFDTGHCYFGGGDPAEVAQKHFGRVAHFHAKNVRPAIMQQVRDENLSFLEGVRRGVFTVPGDEDGAVDFAAVLAIAARHDYSGWMVIEAEQDSSVRIPHTYMSLGLASLQRIAKECGLAPTAQIQAETLKKLFDFNHPFYRPLWIRIAIVSVASGWGLFEFAMGSVVWGVLFCGLAAAAFHGLFITFDPRETEPAEKGKDQEKPGA